MFVFYLGSLSGENGTRKCYDPVTAMQNRRHIPERIPESWNNLVLQAITSSFLRKYTIL